MFEYDRIKLVYDKLIKIPHLQLTDYVKPTPLKDILKEYFQFTDNDYYPYLFGGDDEEMVKHMAENWKGMCIIDTCTSGRHNIDYLVTENNFHKLEFKFDKNNKPVYSPTDVGELMPNTMSFLYDIVDYPKKTRLSRMVANGGNPRWHSHRLLANSGDRRFTSDDDFVTPVVHIPLITNNKSYMGVSTGNPPRDGDVKRHWQRYHPGEIWLLNSYYYHQAINMGRTHRDHIMMYVPMDDKTMFPIIEQAVNEYTGELLDDTELK